MINTIKTTFGFLIAALEKYTPLKFRGDSIEDVYNYLKISEYIATSGQPTEAQFRAIHSKGYDTVINLAPQSVLENSLMTERELLRGLGVEYIHIPVNFQKPRVDDFTKFSRALQALENEKVWVHCAANMRVSAFMYRYRSSVLNEPDEVARLDLVKIWEPIGVWKRFIS
jgi:protein tyrosine phosphatase (PTP) superfamily phosphohydrolase (DUF442 family)